MINVNEILEKRLQDSTFYDEGLIPAIKEIVEEVLKEAVKKGFDVDSQGNMINLVKRDDILDVAKQVNYD